MSLSIIEPKYFEIKKVAKSQYARKVFEYVFMHSGFPKNEIRHSVNGVPSDNVAFYLKRMSEIGVFRTIFEKRETKQGYYDGVNYFDCYYADTFKALQFLLLTLESPPIFVHNPELRKSKYKRSF